MSVSVVILTARDTTAYLDCHNTQITLHTETATTSAAGSLFIRLRRRPAQNRYRRFVPIVDICRLGRRLPTRDDDRSIGSLPAIQVSTNTSNPPKISRLPSKGIGLALG
jgi:hypothetical protein